MHIPGPLGCQRARCQAHAMPDMPYPSSRRHALPLERSFGHRSCAGACQWAVRMPKSLELTSCVVRTVGIPIETMLPVSCVPLVTASLQPAVRTQPAPGRVGRVLGRSPLVHGCAHGDKALQPAELYLALERRRPPVAANELLARRVGAEGAAARRRHWQLRARGLRCADRQARLHRAPLVGDPAGCGMPAPLMPTRE